MSIQEMAIDNADKRLKEIDKLDFAISAWADYDNGLMQGFKDGAKAMLEKACEWLQVDMDLYVQASALDKKQLLKDFRTMMEE